MGVLLDYLHERRLEPCARTVPAAILCCLGFVEKAGGIPAAERLSDMQLVKNTVNQCTAELEAGAEPKRQAPMLPIAAVVSLELMVVNQDAELFVRGFAFYKLLKLWTACRTSDLSGLNPSTLRLTSSGLQGVLDRTKVSGPGKRIRYLPIFVSCHAFLAVPNWLSVGWEIWNREIMSFARDYFLPLPNSDRSGVRQTMADYPQTVALTKSVWRMLRMPVKLDDQWALAEDFLFDAEESLRFWSEHSERNWLISLLASLGVPREQRDFVGRWHAASSSDEYIRTAKQIVLQLQKAAVRGLAENAELCRAGVDDLLDFLQSQGYADGMRQAQEQKLLLTLTEIAAPLQPDNVASALSDPPLPAIPEADAAACPPADEDAPYYISVVGKRRFRRLHRKGGCGTVPGGLREMIPLQHLRGAEYDFACKHCWRRGKAPDAAAELSEGSSSEGSSSSSSSSESATEAESDGE